MKHIIQQELNFFSTEGIIIASTDPSRIGQQNHQGAQFVLEANQAIVIEYDDQYKGAKQGINLPVAIDHQMVGVIGITGKKEEVSQYGEIIKEMTEVLILNNMAKEVVYNRRNAHSHILTIIQDNDSAENQRSLDMVYGIWYRHRQSVLHGHCWPPTE
ncbi:sugar diacid recognition domain-containing protein [Streptococcus hillyeri]|uniref:sugar diacid recognition domain-containing protein n=1 Tax=Streptococcus hillyeri TaxID=2282420 RepID=UPI001FE6E22F|nr:sugar diacid recognition domain-containing protein [Streptococcus hillyeri]